jgi:hypothetical protein
MKWTIMILTQPSRTEFLQRLLNVLEPQVAPYSDQVEIYIRECDHRIPVGENRQIMREEAKGEYSCYIDDDDLVAEDYVESILPLLDGVDYVGFYLHRYDDGNSSGVFKHSLTSEKNSRISHINPIKTSLALTASMAGGFEEDRRWWNALDDSGLVTSEHFLDKEMYFYYYRSRKWDGVPRM